MGEYVGQFSFTFSKEELLELHATADKMNLCPKTQQKRYLAQVSSHF